MVISAMVKALLFLFFLVSVSARIYSFDPVISQVYSESENLESSVKVPASALKDNSIIIENAFSGKDGESSEIFGFSFEFSQKIMNEASLPGSSFSFALDCLNATLLHFASAMNRASPKDALFIFSDTLRISHPGKPLVYTTSLRDKFNLLNSLLNFPSDYKGKYSFLELI
jgi:hypothetical protein